MLVRRLSTAAAPWHCALCAAETAHVDRAAQQRALIAERGSGRRGDDEMLQPSQSPDRALHESFATETECRRAVHLLKAVLGDVLDPPDRLLPLDAPYAEELLGAAGTALLGTLAERIDAHVRAVDPNARRAGTLVSWITGGAGNESTGTYAMHIDKANREQYDLSCLLYLSSAEGDFQGGLFAFNDADRDRLVVPRAGRLLTFCSGAHNVHGVRPVSSGDRLVLSAWFQRGRAARPHNLD